MTSTYALISDVASSIPYDNTTSGLTSTDVQGAIDEIIAENKTYFVSSTTNTTTSSSTYANLAGMSVTVTDTGMYMVMFNGDGYTTGASAGGSFQIALAGTAVADSVRQLACNIALLGIITVSTNTVQAPITCNTIISATAGQTITAQFRSNNAGTSIGMNARNLIVRRLT